MSWYVSYYLGYEDKDGKIYPLGNYDMNGTLHEVFQRSRSFASDFWEWFRPIGDDYISDELRQEFSFEDGEFQDVHYLPLRDFPSEKSFIEEGYFLINDVDYYKEHNILDPEGYDLFYDKMSSFVYSARMKNEVAFGKPEKKYDSDGNEFEYHTCADYMYFAYPKYKSIEYESEILREFARAYEFTLEDGCELVYLEVHG